MTLKLGTETGSLTNHLISGARQGAPEVGKGCTLLSWTDRYAATIVRVSPSGKTFWLVEDKATRTDGNGMSEDQSYILEPGTGRERACRLTKRGWRCEGKAVLVGVKDHYHDFSF